MSNRAASSAWRVWIIAGSMAMAVGAGPGATLASDEPAKAVAPAQTGTVDAAARQALLESAAAVRAVTSLTFRAKEETALGSIKTSGDVLVKLLRSPSGVASFRVEGTYEAPAFPKRQIVGAVLDGKTIQWLQQEDESGTKDGKTFPLYTGKTLYERPLGAPEPGVSRVTLPSNTFREVFLNPDPFRQELDATSLSMEKPQTINGEDCLVVKAVLNRGNIERYIFISAIDKLPRRYVRSNFAGGGKLGDQTLDFSDVSMEKELKIEDIRLVAPVGFKTDTKTLADFPQLSPPPVVPRPPEPQPAMPTKGMTPEQEEEIRRKEEEMKRQEKEGKEPSKKSDEPSKEPKR
jgi:hypothetical protein